jgi:hypothetical protein
MTASRQACTSCHTRSRPRRPPVDPAGQRKSVGARCCAARLRSVGASCEASTGSEPQRLVSRPSIPTKDSIKNALIAIAFLIGAAGAHAQATTAAKEAGKATSETAKQGTENTKAAVSSEPEKSAHQAKAKTHKAKAKSHGHESKEAAKATVK